MPDSRERLCDLMAPRGHAMPLGDEAPLKHGRHGLAVLEHAWLLHGGQHDEEKTVGGA